MSDTQESASLEFTYTFSRKETELLAKHIRKNKIPDGLEKFRDAVYGAMYSSMTIDQAELFFKD